MAWSYSLIRDEITITYGEERSAVKCLSVMWCLLSLDKDHELLRLSIRHASRIADSTVLQAINRQPPADEECFTTQEAASMLGIRTYAISATRSCSVACR